MVPIDTFTSMLAEPSSGSYNTTYFPDGLPAGTGTGAWSSSDAVTHTRPVNCTLWRTVSLAKRSSFCCKSPETLTAPAGPRMSLRPARRTCREMIFAARHRSYSRFDSSPVASGCSRSCSMMKRSIVMTSEPCTVTVRGESDRAALVGPEHRDPVLVHIERQRHPQRVRAQHLERHSVQLDPVARPRRMPARARLFYPGQKLEIQRPPQRLPRLEHELGIERFHHRGHAAQVIRVAVGRHRHCHPAGALASQERDHDPAPRVALGRPGARIDHDPTVVRRAQHCCVTLPYIEEKYR